MREHRDFVKVWGGQLVSTVGDGVHRIAVLWWAQQATGSTVIVVVVAMASVLPTLGAAPLAGWMVDRFSRRTLMIAADATRVVTSATLALALGSGWMSTPLVIAAAAVAAVAGAVFDPALMASVSVLVPEEARATANSMLGAGAALGGIAGPALGGLLIGAVGTASAFWFDAATFLVSLLMVAASVIPMPLRSESSDDDGSFAASMRVVRSNRGVRDLVMVAAGLNLCVAPLGVLIVGLAAGPLRLGGGGFGLLEAAIPVGVVAGFIVASRVAARRHAALVALVGVGAAVGLAGATSWAWGVGLAFVIAGVGVGVANTILPTRFQTIVEPSMQGRVFSVVSALGQAGRPIGLLLAVPLLAGVGVRWGLVVVGAALVLVAWAGRGGLSTEPSAIPPAGGADAADVLEACHR
jgi:MFS transporter, DHA3 family, macrolide efflux protein